MNKDFYIGWMPVAPESFSRYIRKKVMIVGLIVLIIAVLLSVSQKKFSTANFEFGKLTEIKGLYQEFPVPSLKVFSGNDPAGNYSYITIPLVGYGKHGAEGIMKKLEQEKSISLNKKELTIRGTLLYGDGKVLLQVDSHDYPLIAVNDMIESTRLRTNTSDLGELVLNGEILDPKCFFGVMKPGSGKPHRDCAIRCIEGGMSPVFHMVNEEGKSEYFLVLGPHGEKINHQLKQIIADPVRLKAKAVKYDDWNILFVDPENIERITVSRLLGGTGSVVACNPKPE